MKRTTLVSVACWALGAAPALACPVCFSTTDPQVAQGSNLAILALLGITLGMLGAFGAFFIHLKRRSKLMPVSAAPVSSTERPMRVDLAEFESQGGKL